MADKLLNRNFVLLWQGQLVSQLGSQAFLLATMYWLMETTGSASLMGIFMMLSTLPIVLLGPIGGTVADWFPRRTILILADVLSGISVLSLATVMFLAPQAMNVILVWIFAAGILSGIIRAFFQPAITAAIPDLVPTDKLAAANSMNQFSVQISGLLGQGLGGVLYRILGAPLLFLFDGITYLFSAASETFIRIPHVKSEHKNTFRETAAAFRSDTLEGFRYVWSRRGMRNFVLIASVHNFLIMPVLVLLPFFAELNLHGGAEWYGFLLASFSGGAVIGYLLAGALNLSGAIRSTVLIFCLVFAAALLALLGTIEVRILALLVISTVGIMSGMINIFAITLIQSTTPSELRGRTMAFVVTLASAVAPLGMALGGVLGDVTGKNLPLIFGVCGGAAALLSLLGALNRPLRGFLAGSPETS
jgi:MFS family permease